MKLIVDIINTKVLFDEKDEYLKGEFIKQAHRKLGAREQGYIHNPRYKAGVWDGIIDFYDITNDTFPTGLLNLMEELLGDMQAQYGFQYEIVDDRPDPFIYVEDMSKDIVLKDNNVGEITLRNYQYGAVKSIIESYTGIIHAATNCITDDTPILTPKGYKTIKEIFNDNNIPLGSKVKEHNIKYPLINRYGEIEHTSKLFVNGVQDIYKVITYEGDEIKATPNHPLLVLDNGDLVWKKVEELENGDYLVSRLNTNAFGNDNRVYDEYEAYCIGLLVADGSYSRKGEIGFSNNEDILGDIVTKYLTEYINLNPRYKDYGTYFKIGGNSVEKVTSNFHDRLGIGYSKARDKRVPECIRNASRNIQISFLSGFLECETHIHSNSFKVTTKSSSKELLNDIQRMCSNLGIKSSIRYRKNNSYNGKYSHLYFADLCVNGRSAIELLEMLEFKTDFRNDRKNNLLDKKENIKPKNTIPYAKKVLKDYIRSSKKTNKELHGSNQINMQPETIEKILKNNNDGDLELRNKVENIFNKDLQFKKIENIEYVGQKETYDVCMPKTHSFIANTIINHNSGKTEVAGGLMQELLPYLESGERIAFFTDKKEIFEQSALRIQERLGIKVGMIGGGKKDIQQVTFVMIPTINANLKDPEKGVKLTAKEQLYKKISKQVLPRFEGGKNQRKLLEMYIKRFQPKTKADLKLLEELQLIYDTCGTDNSVLMKLRNYNAMYMNTVQKKNKKVFDKHQYIREFLDSVAVMICDEAHHTGSDTWYNSLMTCKNAQYRVGLTGSIDKKNELLNMRLNALFGGVVSRVENDYLISQGHSAKPTIKIFPISAPNDIEKVNQYQPAYDKGIVNNEYRNTLIAKLGKMWYDKDKGVLIIVNHIKHGENISELLDKLKVEHYFIHGELDDETRRQKLQDMRTGKLKVMIATSIVDEGVDISGIHALVLAAGGKSLRQTLQRVGRALRKKKDDNTCQVFDFTDYTNKFLLSHSKERRKIYLEEKFDIVDIQPKN